MIFGSRSHLNKSEAWKVMGRGLYFGVFDHLITAQKDGFFFRERSSPSTARQS